MGTSGCKIEVALLLISADAAPEAITSIVGHLPTKAWRKGDLIQRSALIRKDNGWAFGLPLEDSLQLEERISALLDLVEPFKDRIAHAADRLHLQMEISCAIYVNQQTPDGSFSNRTLRRMADLG